MNTIQYIEYNARHSEVFTFDLPRGHDSWLLLLTHTPAQFYVDNQMVDTSAYSAILFPPNQKIYYRAFKGEYENDWIRFETNEPFVHSFPIIKKPFLPKDFEFCHQLTKMIAWEHANNQEESSVIVDTLFSVLFAKLRDTQKKEQSLLHSHLVQLRKEIYNTPDQPWTVERMADRLHISQGYVQALYKEYFGLPCMQDVIQRRAAYAMDQLLNTTIPVKEIAVTSGYRNVEHFHRQFKKITGKTPLQFRKEQINQLEK